MCIRDRYITLSLKNGDSPEEVRASLSQLLTNRNPEILKRSEVAFNPEPTPEVDEEAMQARQQANQQRDQRKKHMDDIYAFKTFITPFAVMEERDAFFNSPFEILDETETDDPAELFMKLCSKVDQKDDRYYIITQDAEDRGVVSERIDLSRKSLRLSPLDEVYSSDEDSDAPVEEQYEMYAKYLATKGYCLVRISPGWDDFSAVVIAAEQQPAFEAFMSESMPELAYSITASPPTDD